MARRVVLAVNDPNILYLLQRYVEESGLQAAIAGRDGDLAESVVRSGAVLVIVEAGTAAAGSEALRVLRARPETRRTPVLLYSPQGRLAAGVEPEDGHDATTGYLQEYLMYDQFLTALRRVGVRVRAGSRPPAPKAEEVRA